MQYESYGPYDTHAIHGDSIRSRSVWRGAAAGVVGGLVASWVMTQFQSAMSKPSQKSQPQPSSESGDDATVKTANKISESAAGHTLTSEEKKVAGPLVHYVFGSAMGAVYGALAEAAPVTTRGWGLPFGTALWFGADEVAVPALKLAKPPAEYPASTHASALAAHLVYGATTEGVRRAVRAIM